MSENAPIKLEERINGINNVLFRLNLKVGLYKSKFGDMNKDDETVQHFLKNLLEELNSYSRCLADYLDKEK